MKKILCFGIILLLLIIGSLYFLHKPVVKEEKHEEGVASEYLAATVAQRTGDITGAIEHFEKALIEDPKNSEIIKRLYGLYLFIGQYDKAIEHAKRQYELDKINKTKPEDEDPIAYLLIALDNFRNKKTNLNSALLEPLIDPKIPDKSHLDGVVIPMVLAWSYVVNDDYRSAFRVIDGITSEYMLSVFAYNRALINDLANNKKIQIEGKNYTLHEKAEKFLSDVFAEIGQYSFQNANVEEAIIYLRLALYLDHDSIKFKKMLAASYETIAKFREAIDIYHEIPESSENYGNVMIAMALDHHRLQENEKALEILEKLKSISGYEYNALFAIGSIRLSDNQYHDAIKYFEEAKSKLDKPKTENWDLFFNLGVAYDKIDNWEDAEINLKKSVELFSQNPESLNYLAYSWLVRNQNIKRARAMLEAAVIRSGGAPHILDSYGWALYKLGYYTESIPFLEQAANGMPYSSVINDHLGSAYWKVGREREAKYQWQKALDVFDKDQDITPEVTKEEIQNKIENGLRE